MKKVLKASAGTGKTYRLSLEYIAALLEGKYFEEIVVMTFTRKATAEIRERILEHIKDILKKGTESEVFKSLQEINKSVKFDLDLLRKSYNDILKNKDSLNIYTIDSFINKIFKQAIAPYLGVYSYQIVDDVKNEEVIEEVFRKLLDNSDDFALMEKFLTKNTERYIKHYLELIRKILNNRWKFLLINHQKRSRKDVSDLIYYLDECNYILENIAEEKGKEFSEVFYVKDYKTFMPEYLNLESQNAKKEKIYKNHSLFFKKCFWNGNKIRGKAVSHLKDNLELKYEDFLVQLAGHVYNEEMIPYEEEIFMFSSRIFEIYDNIKFKEKIFTHNDISNYTYKYFYNPELDLLDDNQNISDYFFELLGSNVKSLFIDEFQDTSILQWKILKPLIDRCDDVITVGDEKQSIYGWRGGEKELFSRLDQIIDSETESLLTCYRSEREIIEYVNNFFLNLELEWNYSHIDHLKKKNQGYVEVLIGGESAKTNTETKSFNNMAKDKQDEIMELNEKICVDLKKEIVTRLRTFSSYSDIGILTRSNKDLTDIASELDKAGIPYVLESKDNLIEHRAIKPLYFLLSYLNYNDYFQLLKFFRSDLIGVNQKALRYMLTNKSLIESFMMNEEVVLQYEDIQKLLDEIKYIEKMNYKKLSNYIIEESGILNLYGDNSGALKNLYRFFQLMREFNSLSDFMYYINENIESEELKQVGVKEDNAVKLMTIHKSKGLSFETEFFYWNPSSGSGGGSRNMQLYINFDDKYKEANDYLLTNSKYERIFKYLNIDFAEEEDIRNLVEEINNVYVAMTRPEKNLFLYIEAPRKFTVDSEERCWTGSSYEFYENAILNAAQVDDLCELVERKQLGKLSISNRIERFEKKDILDFSEYFKSEEIDMEIIKEVNYKKDFDMTLTKEIGRIKGLAIHYYLEHIRYNTEKEKEFAEKMTRARYGNILGPEKIRKIINRINKFIENNSLYFTDEWKVFNEYELKYEDKTYRIDHLCVHKDKKEIMIIDYKSGSTKEQAQLDKYREIIGHMISGNYKIETKFLEI